MIFRGISRRLARASPAASGVDGCERGGKKSGMTQLILELIDRTCYGWL